MLHLDPTELPIPARAAIHHLLLEELEEPADWEIQYVWANRAKEALELAARATTFVAPGVARDRSTELRGYAVLIRRDERQRAFTVMPSRVGYEAFEVTG